MSDLLGPDSGYSLRALSPLVVSSSTLSAFAPCQVKDSGLPTTGMMSKPSFSRSGAAVESRVMVCALIRLSPVGRAKACTSLEPSGDKAL